MTTNQHLDLNDRVKLVQLNPRGTSYQDLVDIIGAIVADTTASPEGKICQIENVTRWFGKAWINEYGQWIDP